LGDASAAGAEGAARPALERLARPLAGNDCDRAATDRFVDAPLMTTASGDLAVALATGEGPLDERGRAAATSARDARVSSP